MPLRSVEAASREDAIAAAREQFGPMARVIGVRRVRSGGVLGFFATERYVAEVEPDNRPRLGSLPAAARNDGPPGRQGSLAERAAELAAYLQEQDGDQRVDEIAELFAGGPAEAPAPTYSRAGFQAAATPPATPPASLPATARPGAALSSFAATTSSFPASSAFPASAPAAAAAPAAPAPAAASRAEEEPFPRATFARTSRKATAAPAGDLAPPAILRDTADAEPLPPSPFTAALARMVSGDREVQKAVRDALEVQLAGDPGRDGGPWTTERGHAGTTEMATGAQRLSTGAGHQEEKPVSELETMSGAAGESFPRWAAEPPAQPSFDASSREEAIAQILRSALAQNQTDEALADILRKVLADASSEPAAAAPPGPATAPEPAWPPAREPLWAPATQPAGWSAVEAPAPLIAPLPAVPAPVAGLPTAEVAAVPAPAFPPADVAPAPVAPMPTMPVPTAQIPALGAAQPPTPLADIAPDEPIWAEVVLHEPAPAPPPAATAATAATAASLAEAIRAQIVRGQEPAPAPQSPVPVAPPTVTLAAAGAPATAPSAPPTEAFPVTTMPEPPVPVAAAALPFSAEEPTVAEPAAELAGEAAATAWAAAPEAAAVLETEIPAAPATASADEQAPTGAGHESVIAEVAEVALPEMARTASDPAPLPLDATTIMPPLSLLPPLPSSRRSAGRPPVPPPSRPPVPPADGQPEPEHRPEESLATVTRLPVAPVDLDADAAPELDVDVVTEPEATLEPGALDDAPADEPQVVEPKAFEPAGDPFGAVFSGEEPPAPSAPATQELSLDLPAVGAPAEQPDDVVARLLALGIPRDVLGPDFAAQAGAHGTYAALTAALAARLPEAPPPPTGAGEVLFLLGPGVATLRAARSLAAILGLHPDCVQWAARGELAGLAPVNRRMATIDAAIDRRQEAASTGTVTIVAVDAPLRTDAYWMAQMLAVWTPVAVWAVVEATSKPEDLGPWLAELPRVDALVLQDTDLSVDPAAVLERVSMPVALLDGGRATPHRWASLLCERLETDRT